MNTSVLCLRKLPVAKNSMDNNGGIMIFRRSFFVSHCRKLSQMNPSVLCLRKFLVAKKIIDKRAWGLSRFSVERFFYIRMPKTIVGEDFCAAFEKASVAKNSMDNKGGGCYQYFPSKIFCLTVPKTFTGVPFCAVSQNVSGSE